MIWYLLKSAVTGLLQFLSDVEDRSTMQAVDETRCMAVQHGCITQCTQQGWGAVREHTIADFGAVNL